MRGGLMFHGKAHRFEEGWMMREARINVKK
jgi:hypothetical protein